MAATVQNSGYSMVARTFRQHEGRTCLHLLFAKQPNQEPSPLQSMITNSAIVQSVLMRRKYKKFLIWREAFLLISERNLLATVYNGSLFPLSNCIK